jgi:LuxR family maltose regulon positive regulatory protein
VLSPDLSPDLSQSTLVAAAWMHTDRDERSEAEELLDRAGQAAESAQDARIVGAAYALVRARLLRASGDIEQAVEELRTAGGDLGDRGGWFGRELIREQAKLSGGAPAAAPAATDPLGTQVDSWLAQAAEAVRAGNTTRGELLLERALRLAAPEYLRRPVREAPAALQPLLQPTADAMRHHSWLWAQNRRGPARGARRHGESRPQLVVTTPLTGKEQEVLEYLAELLTTEEIADTMFVSVNTVRSHVRSILRKLGAARRNEAVRRAWELGLLPAGPAD